MRIAIIGAGPGGLNAARYALANNFDCTIFEQNGELGGTWIYTEETGTNKYGIPIHSSMYHGLHTNIPKQVMEFSGCPYPQSNVSYLPSQEVLNYLRKYADQYNLEQHIKFFHQVKTVVPIENERWRIIVQDLETNEVSESEFDAVMICSGTNSTPDIPQIPGVETFQGGQFHSHDYRRPEVFTNQRVLVIGSGPSGIDITVLVSKQAEKVILSHHKARIQLDFRNNVIQKPDVKVIKGNTVVFGDDTEEEIDVILYCTGFQYTFPFLSKECGINVDDKYVRPLYKHLINIEHPTMALVGLNFNVCVFPLLDIQNRFFIASLSKNFELPCKHEMLEDTEREMQEKMSKGFLKRHFHSLRDEYQRRYYDDLSRTGNIANVALVVTKIHRDSIESKSKFIDYRRDIYKVIDDENFEVIRQP